MPCVFATKTDLFWFNGSTSIGSLGSVADISFWAPNPQELRRQAVRSLRQERRFLALYRKGGDGDVPVPRSWTKKSGKFGMTWCAEELRSGHPKFWNFERLMKSLWFLADGKWLSKVGSYSRPRDGRSHGKTQRKSKAPFGLEVECQVKVNQNY